jgi:hypothetical protein
MATKLFDPKNDRDLQYLYGLVDGWAQQNLPDAEIIYKLQDLYDSSCWFLVFAAAEKKLYI